MSMYNIYTNILARIPIDAKYDPKLADLFKYDLENYHKFTPSDQDQVAANYKLAVLTKQLLNALEEDTTPTTSPTPPSAQSTAPSAPKPSAPSAPAPSTLLKSQPSRKDIKKFTFDEVKKYYKEYVDIYNKLIDEINLYGIHNITTKIDNKDRDIIANTTDITKEKDIRKLLINLLKKIQVLTEIYNESVSLLNKTDDELKKK